MRKFFGYLRYVVRHRWFVMLECWKMGMVWRGLVHDWHKFLSDEFLPYMCRFGGGIQTGRDKTGYYKAEDTGDPAFDRAWFLHQKRAWHHWQSWCVPRESGAGVIPQEMPQVYACEMICDWLGAGRAQGTPDVMRWYEANAGKLVLHPNTRRVVEEWLNARYGRKPSLTKEDQVKVMVAAYREYERS
jgi:hypothetical protein